VQKISCVGFFSQAESRTASALQHIRMAEEETEGGSEFDEDRCMSPGAKEESDGSPVSDNTDESESSVMIAKGVGSRSQ